MACLHVVSRPDAAETGVQALSDVSLVWRRHLLQSMALAIPAVALSPPLSRMAAAQPASGTAWKVLKPDEVSLLQPILSRLVPADENGPGAREAGVVNFIDRQLTTAWATGDQFYAEGPFQAGTPTQGYQDHRSPAQMLREGLARFGEVVASRGKKFEDLGPQEQDQLLTQLEKGQLDLSPVPGPLFFQTLLDVTMEGFFSDPIYGGNQELAGWKLVGFPGYYSSYITEIERHNMPFTRPAQTLADLARAHEEDAHHGLPASHQPVGPHSHGPTMEPQP
jgi:gluconate 2-dehydrogenase gamma chain